VIWSISYGSVDIVSGAGEETLPDDKASKFVTALWRAEKIIMLNLVGQNLRE